MNILRIVRMLYSKHLIKEIMVVCQIVILVCVYNLAIIPFNSYFQSKAIVEKDSPFDFDNDTVFFGSDSLSDAFMTGNAEVMNNLLQRIEEKYDVFYMYEGVSTFENDDNVIVSTLNVYSEELYNSIDFDLVDNNLRETQLQDGEIPIYISQNLTNLYSIGDTVQIKSYQHKDNEFPCRVVGILKNNTTVITLGSDEGIFTHRISESENFIAARYHQDYFRDSTLYPLFVITNTGNDTLEEIEEQVGNYGQVQTIKELYDNAFEMILSSDEWEILILFLLTIVIIFGYGGYLIVNNMQKRKLCSIFYICGMSLGKVMAVHITAGLLLFAPGIIVGLAISPYMLKMYRGDVFDGYNIYTVMLIVGIIVFCSLSAIIYSVVQTKKISAVDLYRTNE